MHYATPEHNPTMPRTTELPHDRMPQRMVTQIVFTRDHFPHAPYNEGDNDPDEKRMDKVTEAG